MLAARAAITSALSTLLEEAIELHDRFPAPLEHGRTLLALGMTHRRARHRRAARERLRKAEAVFDDVGATIWRDRARRELSRISGRAAGGRDELTPTERQIAERVATGRSNREVAADMFVTVSTVEANLTRIYAKVGVARAVSLRRVAASGDAEWPRARRPRAELRSADDNPTGGIRVRAVARTRFAAPVPGGVLGGWRAGTGPRVLLLHGGPGLDFGYMDELAEELGDRFELAAYQQRGLAPSTTEGPFEVAREVAPPAACSA